MLIQVLVKVYENVSYDMLMSVYVFLAKKNVYIYIYINLLSDKSCFADE